MTINQNHYNRMNFKETLPNSCPPNDVQHPSQKTLWRMLPASEVQESDFDSHAKKFPEKRYPDMCRARSTSLLTSLDACRAVSKMPSPNVASLTHAVEVHVDSAAGVWDQNKPTHVSLWLAAHIDPLTLTGNVSEVK